MEVDSYGHYFRKAKSKLVCRSAQPRWNESFTLDLEGSQNLRLLLYEDAARPVLRGKCTIKVLTLCLFVVNQHPNLSVFFKIKFLICPCVTILLHLRYRLHTLLFGRLVIYRSHGYYDKLF